MVRSACLVDPCGRDRLARGGAEGATGPGNSQANGPQEDGSLESGVRRSRAPTDEVSRTRSANLSGLRTEGVANGAILRREDATLAETVLTESLKRTPLYELHKELPLRHPQHRHRTVGELIEFLQARPEQRARRTTSRRGS